MNLNTNIGVKVTHRLRAYNADGTLYQDSGEQKNLITNGGLDMLASYYYAEAAQYMHLGTGTTAPANSDTALDTVLQDDGATDEVSNTYESSGNSASIAANGTDLYLNYIRLIKSTGTYASGATVHEVGLSPDGGNLFSRLVLTNPITIPNGGFITNTVNLSVLIDGGTQTVVTPISGISEDGTSRMCIVALLGSPVMGATFSGITASGSVDTPSTTSHLWSGEPHHLSEDSSSYKPYVVLSNDSNAITTVNTLGSNEYKDDLTTNSYSAGNYYKTASVSLSGATYISDSGGTNLRTIAIARHNAGGDKYDFRLLFDSTQTIASGNNLSLTFTKTWGRI